MNKESKVEKEISFKLIDLKKIKFFENDPDEICFDFDKKMKVQTQINTIINIDQNNNIIRIILDIYFTQENNDKNKLFGIKTETSYHIKNFDETIKQKEEGKFNIPNQFLSILISIAYSSSRGMLKILTTNDKYSPFILPLVDPKNLIPK